MESEIFHLKKKKFKSEEDVSALEDSRQGCLFCSVNSHEDVLNKNFEFHLSKGKGKRCVVNTGKPYIQCKYCRKVYFKDDEKFKAYMRKEKKPDPPIADSMEQSHEIFLKILSVLQNIDQRLNCK